ncbi:50S ribosomal protein L18 [Desulfotalea psychrophila]|uniref:Large ribosomal subunit protein uL18 n=1 Tax=Desulfotalea psychrophila (strain LSv54 / DSM 12343) TaxID=177439 RepID=RL18_DESPS|nr:50S ribosomal protein L18 [Desulfotalea psychrophila]Q6AP54.1 RecName: Full=Large ribosomal subunit protein uL18; AltName: Full=50S ribosomal protein L18 [Desulfotalea psychrophila LSv54]CAG35870.1 probable 50S ribosomal protein L18 [Desulfotalea psychrophila LSv54]
MAKTNLKTLARAKRISRIRKKISGTSERPRLRVFKSNKHIYAQIIDDASGKSLVAMSTVDKQFDLGDESGKTAAAKKVGVVLAERATAAGIKKVIFDRGGYIYHGRVKSLSEGAREGGLDF